MNHVVIAIVFAFMCMLFVAVLTSSTACAFACQHCQFMHLILFLQEAMDASRQKLLYTVLRTVARSY